MMEASLGTFTDGLSPLAPVREPNANADIDHWSKAAHWTLDEAIALSLGKAPELVRWERLQSLTALGSPFVIQYARRRDLALRAKAWDSFLTRFCPASS